VLATIEATRFLPKSSIERLRKEWNIEKSR
jgi:hypothetical protein